MIDNLFIVVHTFARCISTSLFEYEILLPHYLDLSSNFRGCSLKVHMSKSRLDHMYSVAAYICTAVVASIRQYGYTTLTLKKRREKTRRGLCKNSTNSGSRTPTKHRPITSYRKKTILVTPKRHAGHYRRTCTYGCTGVSQPERTCLHQF